MAHKVAIFGGSFDPIHLGHLAIAKAATEEFGFDELHFVLAKEQPLKQNSLFTAEERFEMLQLALAELQLAGTKFIASRIELEREGLSYSYETVHEFQLAYPESQLFWLLGEDALAQIEDWKNSQKIIDAVSFIVYPRNEDGLDDLLSKYKAHKVSEAPIFDISSTQLRQILQKQEEIDDLIPGSINELIQKFYSKKSSA